MRVLVTGASGHIGSVYSAPVLLEVIVKTYANAYPKLAFGRPVAEMEPFSKPLTMEGT